MAISHSQAVRNSLASAVKTAIDGGTPNAPVIRIRTSGNATIVEIPLNTTSAFSVAANVLTLSTTTAVEATATLAGTNTAANFIILDQTAGGVVVGGTVGAGSGDLALGSSSITSGDLVRLTGGTLTYNDNGAAVPS